MKIDFANLQAQYQKYKDDIDTRIHAVLNKSNYIMGEEVKQLETELSAFSGTKHTITCSNGTDALLLAMMALDIQPDDDVLIDDIVEKNLQGAYHLMNRAASYKNGTFGADIHQVIGLVTDLET